jgi:hypothetical protein
MIKAYKFGLIVIDDDDSNDDNETNGMQRNNETSDETIDDDNTGDISDEWYLLDWEHDQHDFFDKDDNPSTRLSCFAHSIQLTVRDGLKNAPYLLKPLLKCKKISSRTHKSTKLVEMLEDIGKVVSRSNCTRWNSEYLLIKSIVEIGKKTMDEITNAIDDDKLHLSNNDFLILQEAVEILEPFAEITLRIQSESAVNVSLVVPSIVHLIDHLNKIKPHLHFLKKLSTQLDQSIEKRFSGIVKRLLQKTIFDEDPFSDPVYFVSTILDPQFKFFWLSQMHYKPAVEARMKQSLIQLLLDQCEMNNSLQHEDSQSTQRVSPTLFISNSRTTQSSNTSIIKKQKLFQYDYCDNSSLEPVSKPIDELNLYISDSTKVNFSLYWKYSGLKILKNVVKRIFSIQASSAPIERGFSQAGLIMSPRRTRMSDEVFTNMVFLRVNQQII